MSDLSGEEPIGTEDVEIIITTGKPGKNNTAGQYGDFGEYQDAQDDFVNSAINNKFNEINQVLGMGGRSVPANK